MGDAAEDNGEWLSRDPPTWQDARSRIWDEYPETLLNGPGTRDLPGGARAMSVDMCRDAWAVVGEIDRIIGRTPASADYERISSRFIDEWQTWAYSLGGGQDDQGLVRMWKDAAYLASALDRLTGEPGSVREVCRDPYPWEVRNG